MFAAKTVFIVGAGASAEVGLPVGRALLEDIATALNIRFSNRYDQSSGSSGIRHALSIFAKKEGLDENEYYKAGRKISDALPIAPSIDNFLDARKDDKCIQLCGKLGIVQKILEAERKSKLFAGEDDRKEVLSGVATTWYSALARLLVQRTDRANVSNFFDNISFITFNYDRCIEQFFFHALQKYYSLELGETLTVLQKLKVLRPYGSVGDIPWHTGVVSPVNFGAQVQPEDLLRAAAQIRTFTERVADESSLVAIRHELASAKTVVFLGFGYLQQNMELLSVSQASYAQRVFATTYGISFSDRQIVAADIVRSLKKTAENLVVELLAPHLQCADLFSEFSRGIAR